MGQAVEARLPTRRVNAATLLRAEPDGCCMARASAELGSPREPYRVRSDAALGKISGRDDHQGPVSFQALQSSILVLHRAFYLRGDRQGCSWRQQFLDADPAPALQIFEATQRRIRS